MGTFIPVGAVSSIQWDRVGNINTGSNGSEEGGGCGGRHIGTRACGHVPQKLREQNLDTKEVSSWLVLKWKESRADPSFVLY